jgi:hypothetical protein
MCYRNTKSNPYIFLGISIEDRYYNRVKKLTFLGKIRYVWDSGYLCCEKALKPIKAIQPSISTMKMCLKILVKSIECDIRNIQKICIKFLTWNMYQNCYLLKTI